MPLNEAILPGANSGGETKAARDSKFLTPIALSDGFVALESHSTDPKEEIETATVLQQNLVYTSPKKHWQNSF